MKIKNESDLIDHIIKKTQISSNDVIKSIGDDCAVVKSGNKYLVMTTDTSLEGPHFTRDYTPEEIGYKALATNLSDIAAMGGIPKYILMAITLPKLDTYWIKGFYKGINTLIKKYNLSLIGGDTNKGKLSITIQVIGECKKNIMYRSDAKLNDDIYISGRIGLARTALMIKKMKNRDDLKYFKKYLHRPVPRIELGKELCKIANACIDLSDGLSKDLRLICKASKVGANVDLDKLPILKRLYSVIPKKRIYEAIIGGGEDYELCFTINKRYRDKLKEISHKFNIPLTRIGSITSGEINYYSKNSLIKLNITGFDHFCK
tara:strand:+ start:4746 stop:5699 length:954 start_codon:yes stop_codon:yes gene_type:complete